nr:hypothetical protein [Nanoarchaeum sp.]
MVENIEINEEFVRSEMIPTKNLGDNYGNYSFRTQGRMAYWTVQQFHDYVEIGKKLLAEITDNEDYGLFKIRLELFEQCVESDLARGETLEDLTED